MRSARVKRGRPGVAGDAIAVPRGGDGPGDIRRGRDRKGDRDLAREGLDARRGQHRRERDAARRRAAARRSRAAGRGSGASACGSCGPRAVGHGRVARARRRAGGRHARDVGAEMRRDAAHQTVVGAGEEKREGECRHPSPRAIVPKSHHVHTQYIGIGASKVVSERSTLEGGDRTVLVPDWSTPPRTGPEGLGCRRGGCGALAREATPATRIIPALVSRVSA